MVEEPTDVTDDSPESHGVAGTLLRSRRHLAFLVVAPLTLAAVALSVTGAGGLFTVTIPPHVYLFSFLGATVYVFTSLDNRFESHAWRTASKAFAALPLAAGVYLLAFSFPGVSGDAAVNADRLVAGLAFVAGAFVNLTLKALGGLAERLLGVRRSN